MKIPGCRLSFALLLVWAVSPAWVRAGTISGDGVEIRFDDERVPRAIAVSAARRAPRYLDAILQRVGKDYAPMDTVRIHLHGPADPRARDHYPRVDAKGEVHLYQFGPDPGSHLTPLAHELVHVVRNPHLNGRDGFVEEGFASFVAARIDSTLAGFPFFGHDIDVVAAQWMGGDEDLPLALMRLGHGRVNLACRLQTYTLRTSFFVELGNRYGDQRVIDFADVVARTGRVDFEAALGRSFVDLELGWRDAVWGRFIADAQSIDAATAYREAPELRGIRVCAKESSVTWKPGSGARAAGLWRRRTAEVHHADHRADLARLERAIVEIEALEMEADAEAERAALLGFARWRLMVSRRARGENVDPALLQRAVDALRDAVDLAPDRAEVHALAATVAGALVRTDPGRHGPALGPTIEAWWTRTFELDPDAPRVLLLNALRLFWTPPEHGGDRARALDAFARAVGAFDALDPGPIERTTTWGHAESRAWWADALLQIGEGQRAEDLYREALAIEPGYWYVETLQLPQIGEADE